MDKADTIHGPMELTDDPEDLICRSLKLTGEWSFTEVRIFASLVSEQDYVWDAGAFIGTFSLGVRQLRGARVLAIEPDRQSVELLRKNLKANARGGYDVVDKAIGSREGVVRAVPLGLEHNRGAQRFEPVEAPAENDTVVTCTTLRGLRREFGDYTALKLDIEGGEFEALRADARFIREAKPVLWAECNETNRVKELLGLFLWAELSPVYVAFPAFRRANYRGTPNQIYPSAYEAAIFGGPSNRFSDLPETLGGEEIIIRPLASFEDLKRAMWDTPRWGLEEWATMSRPQLIACLGRMYCCERFAGFLGDSCSFGNPIIPPVNTTYRNDW